MGIENWMKAISLVIVIGGIVFGFVKTWTTFQLNIEQIKAKIAEIEKSESTNHSISLSNFADAITKIEEMRRERREEIRDLRSDTRTEALILKREIFGQITENRTDNRVEHSEIKKSLAAVEKALIEIVTEIRLSKGVRVNKVKEEATG